jgi:hypothetical protein
VAGGNEAGGTGNAAYVEALEAQHAISVMASTDTLIEGGEVHHFHGDAVYVGGGSKRTAVRRLYGHHTGRHAVAATWATDTVVDRSAFCEVRYCGVDVEPNGTAWSVERLEVRRTWFGPVRLNLLSARSSRPIRGIRFVDCDVPAFKVSVQARILGCISNVVFSNVRARNVEDPSSGAVAGFAGIDGLWLHDVTQPTKRPSTVLARVANSKGVWAARCTPVVEVQPVEVAA